MSYSHITVAPAGAVLIVTINRPAQSNKLNNEAMDEMVEALQAAETSPDCGAVVLTGSGEYFCSGGELGDFRSKSPVEIRAFGDRFVRLHMSIARLCKPVVAAIQGHAHGGGFSLVEVCDLAVAAEEVTFGVPEITIGLAPMMALSGVGRTLSRKGVMELALLGEMISAARAKEIGLVNWVETRQQVVPKALAVATRIAAASPTAVMTCKRLYDEADALGYQRQLECGLSMLITLLKSTDAGEALTAREQNRAPRWIGR